MIIYPAIDIKDGRCVMLSQGVLDREKVYSQNPEEIAVKWGGLGARFLHLVDLDGAFYGESANRNIIKRIMDTLSIPVQVGGGIRSMEKIKLFLDEYKAARVIMGTSAITDLGLLKRAIEAYGDKIVVGVDAKEGQVAIQGWVKNTGTKALDFGKQLFEMGADTVIYTDISKDGMLQGPNIDATKAMVEETGLKIIAAGGISKLEDLKSLKKIGVSGAIIGKALYSGAIRLKDALDYEGD